MSKKHENCEGGCTCGKVRYKVTSDPLIVHCCHCRWCQRQTGASFALNALIETERVELLQGEVEEVTTASPSGTGQVIARCPECKVAVWSNYLVAGRHIRFVRVGTLDAPDQLPPDVHIYTSTKQPWVVLPPEDYAVAGSYVVEETWSPDSLKRREEYVKRRGD